MTDRELMQQTLEALNAVRLSGDVVVVVTPEKSIYIDPLRRALRERLAQPDHDWEAEYTKQVELHNQTLDELRDALAQPEQEPVVKWDASAPLVVTPHPAFQATQQRREWVGLTDEEIDTLVIGKDGLPNSHLEFARAIEAALRSKNNG